MGFDAALRATHHGCCLGDVQFFPITQQKRLPLTLWQPLQFFLNYFNNLSSFQEFGGPIPGLGSIRALQGLERVGIVVFPPRGEGREQRHPQRPHLLPAIKVANGVLKDALEEHRQLGRRLGTVLLSKLEHGVLHYIECALRLPDREQRLLVRASLYAREELGQFVSGGQKSFLFCRRK